MVDRLDLPDLHKPYLDVLGGSNEDSVSVIIGLSKDSVEVLQPLHDAHSHLPPVTGLVWAGVESGPEPLADLLDSALQLLALEEGDEDTLEDLVSGVGVLQGVLDLGHAEEDISPAGSPQHLLESWQSLSEDDSGNKTKLEASTRSSFILRLMVNIWVRLEHRVSRHLECLTTISYHNFKLQ